MHVQQLTIYIHLQSERRFHSQYWVTLKAKITYSLPTIETLTIYLYSYVIT